MKIIVRILFYIGALVLSTSIGVVIGTGPIFWRNLLVGLVIAAAVVLCFLSIRFNHADLRHRWNLLLICLLRQYLSIRNWYRKLKLRLLLWLICKLQGRRKSPPPPSFDRRGPDKENGHFVYYTGQIGVA